MLKPRLVLFPFLFGSRSALLCAASGVTSYRSETFDVCDDDRKIMKHVCTKVKINVLM